MTDPTTEPPRDSPPPGAGPSWRPPRDAGGNLASVIFGLVLIAIGAWYFLDHTLDLAMPRIDWSEIWPLAIIVAGAVVLLRSSGKRA